MCSGYILDQIIKPYMKYVFPLARDFADQDKSVF